MIGTVLILIWEPLPLELTIFCSLLPLQCVIHFMAVLNSQPNNIGSLNPCVFKILIIKDKILPFYNCISIKHDTTTKILISKIYTHIQMFITDISQWPAIKASVRYKISVLCCIICTSFCLYRAAVVEVMALNTSTAELCCMNHSIRIEMNIQKSLKNITATSTAHIMCY
jgi:hypothetical protein